jgi:hypothetical protein
MAHFRFNKHRSHPRCVLLPEHAVVLDHAAASNGSAVGEGDDRKWDLILLRMSAQPGQNDFSRVMALAPPLVEDPITDGLQVLRALRELFHSPFHWRRYCLPNCDDRTDPRRIFPVLLSVSDSLTRRPCPRTVREGADPGTRSTLCVLPGFQVARFNFLFLFAFFARRHLAFLFGFQ